ncbi:MAG: ECF transporter S component [Eubacteriales bacterium]
MSIKKWISYGIMCIGMPIVTFGGAMLFENKQAAWLSMCIAVFACIPFFLRFEKKQNNTARLVIVAVMVALSVAGRIVFTAIPGFKPVTALVVLTGMYFGSEAGFMTGALAAVISNFYFGQGLWTPIQMFVWGFLGLLAGVFARQLKKNRIALLIGAVLSGVLFSLLMDIWTVLWADGTFRITRYLAAITASGYFTVIYAVSNAVFLLLLKPPIGAVLERIQSKYGV